MSKKDKTAGERWHNGHALDLGCFLGRHIGIARRAAQMQVCVSDPAELFADRRGECARAAANGQSSGRPERSTSGPCSASTAVPTEASSGLTLSPTGTLDKLGAVDILFVCGGINVREAVSPALLTALRRLAERRVPLGALCTGGYALARAGLLDNFSATIHWENLSALREEFPQGANQRSAVHDRPRPLHLFGRHRAPRSHAESDSGEARSTHLAVGVRAIHRRAGAQGHGSSIHPAARAGRECRTAA